MTNETDLKKKKEVEEACNVGMFFCWQSVVACYMIASNQLWLLVVPTEACFAVSFDCRLCLWGPVLLKYAFLRNFKCVCTLNFKIHISGNDPWIIAQVYTCFRVLGVMRVCVAMWCDVCVCVAIWCGVCVCVRVQVQMHVFVWIANIKDFGLLSLRKVIG